MKVDLKNKIALVTASSKGIGLSVARRLFEAGAKVGICARHREGVKQAAQMIGKEDASRLFTLVGDIGDRRFLETLVKKTTDHFGDSIDILINNNGGPPSGETLGFSEKDWHGAIERNLMSVVRLCSLVVPDMKKKHWGRIVNLTSTTAKEPDSGMVLSNVTRSAVAAYGKTLARDVGSFGITVNTVLTGACLTDRLRSLIEKSLPGREACRGCTPPSTLFTAFS